MVLHQIGFNYCTQKIAKDWLPRRNASSCSTPPPTPRDLNRWRWFGLVTQRAIWWGSFRSITEMILKIVQYVVTYDKTKAPFQWSATANTIQEKLQRLC